MSLILNIDTAIDTAYVSIAKEGIVLDHASNKDQKDHAAFLHVAIYDLLKRTAISMKELDAVAVTGGPGSYTGLRVGMASAKGICFALKKPLIIIGTLDLLAYAVIQQLKNETVEPGTLFCPMIDARRMEVFSAVFDEGLSVISGPAAIVLAQESYANMMLKNKVVFFGSGALKWQQICTNINAIFYKREINSLYLSTLSHLKYNSNSFSDLAYSEPLYLKEFYTARFSG